MCISESPGWRVKTPISGPTLGVSDTVGLGWGPIMFTSNRFPGEGEAAHLETTLGRILPFL